MKKKYYRPLKILGLAAVLACVAGWFQFDSFSDGRRGVVVLAGCFGIAALVVGCLGIWCLLRK